jgi:preprotein translocase subunit SecY
MASSSAVSSSAFDKKDVYADLRGRLLFVLFGMFVFRLGAHIPVPGVNVHMLADLFNQHKTGILGLFNMFSGGALSRLTVFALGVMPYITSSIIMQLLTATVPHLEQLKKEGDTGRRRINQYTRLATLGLGLFQGYGIARWLAYGGYAYSQSFSFYFIASLTLTTGTMFLMWLGEQISEKGIGNGISLIIFSGIVSRLPQAVGGVLSQLKQGQMQPIAVLVLACVVAAVIVFVVFMERGQRKIVINYARRPQHGAGSGQRVSFLPLKINMAGVLPPIFASAVIILPSTIINWASQKQHWDWLSELGLQMSPGAPLYLILFSLSIVFFAFFYTAMIFNPRETADDLKKTGALLPGVRPGEQTAEYIDTVMGRLTLIGAGYLILVAMVPEVMIHAWNVPFYFGGTSLLIVVVVVMDFMTQIQTHLMSQKYETILKKSHFSRKSLKS